MKSFPPPYTVPKRALPAARPISRPQPSSTMRSTVLLSLLLSPDGGVPHHRHGHGARGPRSN